MSIGKSTLKKFTKQWHVSLPNMTFYPSLSFSVYFICCFNMPLQCKLHYEGALLLAVPLYLQVAFVCVQVIWSVMLAFVRSAVAAVSAAVLIV